MRLWSTSANLGGVVRWNRRNRWPAVLSTCLFVVSTVAVAGRAHAQGGSSSPTAPGSAPSKAGEAKPSPAKPSPTAAPATPTATPTAAPAPTPTATSNAAPTPPRDAGAASDDAVDIDALRQEYLKLRDELFASRARAATVASQLYSARVSVRLNYSSGRYFSVSRSSIRLDGATVYDNSDGAIANDDGVRFEGFIAPGRHVITFRVEARGKDDERFSSATEDTITVQAVAGKDLIIVAKARDSGDVAYAWKKREAGTYKLGLDVSIKTVAQAGQTKGRKAAVPGRPPHHANRDHATERQRGPRAIAQR